MYVKPKPGLRVIDPVRKQFMSEEGMEVDDYDLYWARRLRDGDVVQASNLSTATTTIDADSADDYESTASHRKKAK